MIAVHDVDTRQEILINPKYIVAASSSTKRPGSWLQVVGIEGDLTVEEPYETLRDRINEALILSDAKGER